MRKITTILLTAYCILLFTGCNLFKLSPLEYNNQVVDVLNSTSEAIEASILIYGETVPDIVTEETEIDVISMEAYLEETEKVIGKASRVLYLESKDEEQQIEVLAEFENYLTTGEAYSALYAEILEYYSSGTYIDDLTQVKPYNNDLYEAYNAFIESNNTLVDILDRYIY